MNLGNLRNLQVLSIFYRNMSETRVRHGGRSRDTPKSFVDLRSQVIWGNQLIQHKNKCLFYNHWINDNIIYVNDLLNQNGEIDANIILGKLKNRCNWISEFSILKNAISNQWKLVFRSENSIKAKVRQQSFFSIQNMTNKLFVTLPTTQLISYKSIYNYLLKSTQGKPITEKYVGNYIQIRHKSWFLVFCLLFSSLWFKNKRNTTI